MSTRNARGIFTVQLINIKVGPGLGFFFSSFPPSSPLLPPLWPPRPLESKVIQIQSDHLLAASPPVAAMERSKVTCSIQVCWRKLGPHQEGLLWPSPKSTGLLAGWVPIFLPHPWCCSPTQTTSSPSRSTSYHGAWREFSLLLQPPLLSSSEERLGCFLEALLSLLPIYFLHVLLLSPKFLLGG